MALTGSLLALPSAALVLAAGLLAVLSVAGTAGAAFPGENGKIAFVSNRDGNSEIYTMNADGSGQTNVSDSPGADSGPAFSPDGQRIAFVSRRDGNAEIYVMNADGSGQANITSTAAEDTDPAFSPDGQRIAFASRRDGNSEIYTMNADGSGQTNVTKSGLEDFQPAFSPDGQRIAFIRRPPPSPYPGPSVEEIFAMALDGSDLTPLTEDNPDADPTFSPDGQTLAFSRNIFRHHKIHTMAADGSNETNVSDIPGSCGHLFDDFDPAFSPDGQRIAFASNRQGFVTCSFENFEIYAIAPDGSGVTRLTHDAAFDGDPDWQPLSRSQARPGGQPRRAAPPQSPTPADLRLGACTTERRGSGGPDSLIGTPASDRLSGLGGNDRLAGLAGNDCLSGGSGNDIVAGDSGNDVLAGGSGNDRLTAGRGRNRYSAGSGRDTVNARNRRRDRIDCGPGRDRATVDRLDRVRRCERVRRR